jgi:formate hydrogenlyase subunit 6/NADH:ubiquinone oxidoreductase subunit I
MYRDIYRNAKYQERRKVNTYGIKSLPCVYCYRWIDAYGISATNVSLNSITQKLINVQLLFIIHFFYSFAFE